MAFAHPSLCVRLEKLVSVEKDHADHYAVPSEQERCHYLSLVPQWVVPSVEEQLVDGQASRSVETTYRRYTLKMLLWVGHSPEPPNSKGATRREAVHGKRARGLYGGDGLEASRHRT